METKATHLGATDNIEQLSNYKYHEGLGN